VPRALLARQVMVGRGDRGTCERLIHLVYELLDAHDDTTRIAPVGSPIRSDLVAPPRLYTRPLAGGREVVAAGASGLASGPTILLKNAIVTQPGAVRSPTYRVRGAAGVPGGFRGVSLV
jgi:hypothetical protein